MQVFWVLVPALAVGCATAPEPTPADRVVPELFDIGPPSPRSARPPLRTVPSGHALREAAVPSLRRRLATTRAPGLVVQGERSLRAVVDRVRIATGLPLVVTSRAEEAVHDEGLVFDVDLEHPLLARDLLNLIAELAGPSVRWEVRHEAVILDTAEHSAAEARVMRTYDVRTLTFARTDFVAPRIDRIRLLDELEDDDGGGPFGAVGERVARISPDEVVELVMEHVAPETWSRDGVSIEVGEGLLIVVQTPAVHARIRRYLRALGAY